jgi:signal transduction histidine kinase
VQAERALRQADRKKDTFLATLSHELRNPLAPIRAAAQVIRLSPGVDARADRAAAIIERQSAQLARLVDDLLDVSRLNFGSLQLQRRQLDLRDLVEAALETSRPVLEAGRHRLEVRLGQRPLPVYADETRIVQCVANLVNNACKFTPAGGSVAVDVRALDASDGSWATVTVSDNGQGIAPDMLEKVFELFTQERRSGMGGNTGLGIGLALVRRLVQMHGGQVQARSEGVGRGSSFEIRLPLRLDTPDAAGAPGASSGSGEPGEPGEPRPL